MFHRFLFGIFFAVMLISSSAYSLTLTELKACVVKDIARLKQVENYKELALVESFSATAFLITLTDPRNENPQLTLEGQDLEDRLAYLQKVNETVLAANSCDDVSVVAATKFDFEKLFIQYTEVVLNYFGAAGESYLRLMRNIGLEKASLTITKNELLLQIGRAHV